MGCKYFTYCEWYSSYTAICILNDEVEQYYRDNTSMEIYEVLAEPASVDASMCDRLNPHVEGVGDQTVPKPATDPLPDPHQKQSDPEGPFPKSPSHCQLKETVGWCG